MLSLCAAPRLVVAPATVTPRRSQVVTCAQAGAEQPVERRAVLGLCLAAVLGLSVSAQSAEASQAAPKNSYRASSEGFNMEGIKKQGITPKRKKQLLAKLKANIGK